MAEGVATRDRSLAGRPGRAHAAATVVSRDHATALRRNNAELKCTKSIQNSQTFSTVLHRGNLGFSTDFCTEIEVYMSSLKVRKAQALDPWKAARRRVKIAERDRFFSSLFYT